MWHLRAADERLTQELCAETGLPRAVVRALVVRGLADGQAIRAFLAARDDLSGFRQPVAAPAMQLATSRIRQAIAASEPIGLYGDYDCDGVTSAAILFRYLSRGLSADVRPRLPDRFRDGYGIHPAAVDQLADQGCKVILTCDNGVAAHAAATRARERGIDLIVTDHHQVPEQLPDAFAIVHPQVAFPEFKDLCGAGVAFLLVVALEGHLSGRLESFLDLVAMGTIADVVPLDGPNRALVWAGLTQMRKGKAHPGTKALAEAAGVAMPQASARDIGFSLAPRLNAAGRLETPDVGFQLLVTNDRNEAHRLANHLDQVNTERRSRSSQLEARVLELIAAEVDVERTPFIVMGREDFHHGLVGLAAGRVAERYRTPVLLLAPNGDGTWRGSGRSPAGFDLYRSLLACSEQLLAFGGHAQAAGCRVGTDGLDALRDALNRHLTEIGWRRPSDDHWLDAELPFAEATPALLEALEELEPFGQRMPAPALGLLGARVVSVQRRGTDRQHLFMQLDDGSDVREVICWGQGERAPAIGDRIQIRYLPRWNEFRGERRLQFVAEPDFEVLSERTAVAVTRRIPGAGPGARASEIPPLAGGTGGPALIDARKTRWKAYEDTPGLAVYAHSEPPAGVWLVPDDPLPQPLGTVVVADVPADLETWRSLLSGSRTLVLAWRGVDGAALDEAALIAVYDHLVGRQGIELFTAIASSPVPLAEAQAAVSIFREAGLMVRSETGWCLLSPPEGPIALSSLAAFRRHVAERSFRERLCNATPEQAVALAQLGAGSGLEPTLPA